MGQGRGAGGASRGSGPGCRRRLRKVRAPVQGARVRGQGPGCRGCVAGVRHPGAGGVSAGSGPGWGCVAGVRPGCGGQARVRGQRQVWPGPHSPSAASPPSSSSSSSRWRPSLAAAIAPRGRSRERGDHVIATPEVAAGADGAGAGPGPAWPWAAAGLRGARGLMAAALGAPRTDPWRRSPTSWARRCAVSAAGAGAGRGRRPGVAGRGSWVGPAKSPVLPLPLQRRCSPRRPSTRATRGC